MQREWMAFKWMCRSDREKKGLTCCGIDAKDIYEQEKMSTEWIYIMPYFLEIWERIIERRLSEETTAGEE